MTKSIKIARFILFLLLSALLIVAVKNCSEKPYLMSPEQVMGDTLQNLPDGHLQERQGEITDSVGDDKVIYNKWQKMSDSLTPIASPSALIAEHCYKILISPYPGPPAYAITCEGDTILNDAKTALRVLVAEYMKVDSVLKAIQVKPDTGEGRGHE